MAGTATQAFQPRIGASLIPGVFRGPWHLPLFYMPRVEIYYTQPIWGRMATTVPLSVLLTRIYDNTFGGLFATILMHTW